jgi:hypothetical protein
LLLQRKVAKEKSPAVNAARSLNKLENNEKESRLWRDDTSAFSVFYAYSDSQPICFERQGILRAFLLHF